MKHKKALVSVLLPVKNGDDTIRRSLNSIIGQTYSNFELIIVDNFSTDNTKEIVKEYSKKDKRIRFFQKGPERASQMNYGAKKARGKYIFITNCDFEVDKNFLELAVKKCEKEGFQICNGHIKSETSGFWSKVKAMEREMYIDDPLMETALFYERKLFLEIGGFDEKMLGVEEELQNRLDDRGIKLGIIPAFQVHIDEIDSLKEIALKSFYYGLYDAAYFRKRPIKAFRKRFPVRKAFVRNRRTLTNDIKLFIGFLILKAVQYSLGIIGLAFGLLGTPLNKKMQAVIYGKN